MIHYRVAIMSGSVARTSSHVFNNATLPLGLALADHRPDAIKADAPLQRSPNVHRGKLVSDPAAESLGLPCEDPLRVPSA